MGDGDKKPRSDAAERRAFKLEQEKAKRATKRREVFKKATTGCTGTGRADTSKRKRFPIYKLLIVY